MSKLANCSPYRQYTSDKILKESFSMEGFFNVGHVNSSGNILPTSLDYGIFTLSHPYLYCISEGAISGSTPWVKAGYNGEVDGSAAMEDIWGPGGAYVYPTSSVRMEVFTNSSDDSSTGIGIQQVTITYLDSNFEEHSEDLSLIGSGSAQTVATNIYRVNSFRAKTCGSSKAAVGNIDLRDLNHTTVYSRIEANHAVARDIQYTVPKNKLLFVTSVVVGAGSKVAGRAVRFITRATYDNILRQRINFFMSYTDLMLQDGAIFIPLEVPTRFTEGVDIKVSAVSPDGEVYTTCTLRGWLKSI